MKQIQKVVSIALVALVVGGAAARAQTKEPVSIGVIANLTGMDVRTSTDMVRGVQLAADDVNKAGGADGHPIQLIIEDAQYKTQEALNAAVKLYDIDKVSAIIMFGGSSIELAVAPIAKQKGKIIVNTSASSAQLGDFGGTVYSVLPLDDIVGKALGDYVAAQGVKTAAFVAPNNTYGNGLMDAAAKAFVAQGGKVAARVAYSEGQPDYRADVQQIVAAKPDAIVTTGYGDDSRTIFKAAQTQGLKQIWYAGYPSILTVENEAWMNGKLVGVDNGGLTGDVAKKVRAAYITKFGNDTSLTHVFYGYDALMLAERAAAMPGGLTQANMGKSIDGYQGATGIIKWDGRGQRIDPPIDIVAYKDGKLVETASH